MYSSNVEHVIAKEGTNHGHFYMFALGHSHAPDGDEDFPPDKGGLQQAKKVYKNSHPTILAGSVWKKLQAFDKAMKGKRIIPVSKIDQKALPTEKGAQKLSVPVITTLKWSEAAHDEAAEKKLTPTFALTSPYKKDYVEEFNSKIPKEARFWHKWDKAWIIDTAYMPLALMLLHKHFMVDPKEDEQTVSDPMEYALYADKKKGKGNLSVKKGSDGWFAISTPWNPEFVNAIKSLPYGTRKWDQYEKVWKVKDNGPDGHPNVADIVQMVKKFYGKDPVVQEDLDNPLVTDMLWLMSSGGAVIA